MSESIQLKCPHCGHVWQQDLDELEKPEEIWKSFNAQPQVKVEKYRARCPVDGTYLIFEVSEE
jgi:hypothetical protein